MYHNIVNDVDKIVSYGSEVRCVEANSIPLVTNKNAATHADVTLLITSLNMQLR